MKRRLLKRGRGRPRKSVSINGSEEINSEFNYSKLKNDEGVTSFKEEDVKQELSYLSGYTSFIKDQSQNNNY